MTANSCVDDRGSASVITDVVTAMRLERYRKHETTWRESQQTAFSLATKRSFILSHRKTMRTIECG